METKLKNSLRKIREERRLSQDQLADLIDTDKTVISKLELSRRKLTSGWLFKLTRALSASADEILADPSQFRDETTEKLHPENLTDFSTEKVTASEPPSKHNDGGTMEEHLTEDEQDLLEAFRDLDPQARLNVLKELSHLAISARRTRRGKHRGRA